MASSQKLGGRQGSASGRVAIITRRRTADLVTAFKPSMSFDLTLAKFNHICTPPSDIILFYADCWTAHELMEPDSTFLTEVVCLTLT